MTPFIQVDPKESLTVSAAILDSCKRADKAAMLVEVACRAHWPTWDRMRADHQRKWRDKMRAALAAYELARTNFRP